MTQSSQQLRDMEATIDALRTKLNEVELHQQKDTPEQVSGFFGFKGKETEPEPEPEPEPVTDTLPPPIQTLPQPYAMDTQSELLPPPTMASEQKKPGIAVFEVSQVSVSNDPETASKNTTYIPSGSFMRSVLLGGLDAPTGGQAQNNPMPVLLRVQNDAFLPNQYRGKLKECFMIGSAYGDISSERAYSRLESLSCTLHNGKSIDIPVKGYIVGEDGKTGMRGRLVSKRGQAIANALMAGVLSGAGRGLQQSAMFIGASPLGAVGAIRGGTRQQFQAGVGAGIGRSLDRISNYYLNLADQMFPILEVDAGRVVEIVLTKGIEIDLGVAESTSFVPTVRNVPGRFANNG
jgi:conjugal transfer pilus assembly protein TraB